MEVIIERGQRQDEKPANNPNHCIDCGRDTAHFDPVARLWVCPCGWRDGRRQAI
jgi:hypothetical protein